MSVIATVEAVLKANNSDFQKKINSTISDMKRLKSQAESINRGMESLGSGLTSWGTKLSLALTAPITLMGGLAVRAMAQQEQATAELQASLERTGASAESVVASMKKFEDISQTLMNTTTYSDDAALGAMSMATNFGVAADQMEGFMKGVVGLAARMKTDLPQAVRMMMMGINGNTRALKMAGIQIGDNLSKEQKMQQLLAQTSSFYGLATAQVNTFSGRMTQLKNIFEDSIEPIGKFIMDSLDLTNNIARMSTLIREGVQWFMGLSESTRQWILVAAGAAAVLGPTLIMFGLLASNIGAIIGLVTSLASGFVAFLAVLPTLVVFAGVVYGMYKVFTALDTSALKLGDTFDGVFTSGTKNMSAMAIALENVRRGLYFCINFAQGFWIELKYTFMKGWVVISEFVGFIRDSFVVALPAIVKGFWFLFTNATAVAMVKMGVKISEMVGYFEAAAASIKELFNNAVFPFLSSGFQTIFEAVGKFLQNPTGGFQADFSSIARGFGQAMDKVIENSGDRFKEVGAKAKDALANADYQGLQQFNEDIKQNFTAEQIKALESFTKGGMFGFNNMLDRNDALDAQKQKEKDKLMGTEAWGDEFLKMWEKILNKIKNTSKPGEGIGPLGKAPGDQFMTVPMKYAGAMEKGSLEAYKAELGGDVMVKVASNTERTADAAEDTAESMEEVARNMGGIFTMESSTAV